MVIETLLKELLPKSYSLIDQIVALTVINTSLAISLAMIFLVLYWVVTKSFETIKTVFAVLGIMLMLAICIGLEITGQISAGAWALVILTGLLNFGSIAGYKIASSASSGYIISILLAFICLGSDVGWMVTIIGSIFVFTIPILHSKGWIHSVFPYTDSNITFEAPTLSLTFLLTALILENLTNLIKNISP